MQLRERERERENRRAKHEEYRLEQLKRLFLHFLSGHGSMNKCSIRRVKRHDLYSHPDTHPALSNGTILLPIDFVVRVLCRIEKRTSEMAQDTLLVSCDTLALLLTRLQIFMQIRIFIRV